MRIELSEATTACTLPTAERPLRVAEFEQLFANAASPVERLSAQTARIALRPEPTVAALAADLVVRETQCCSFFTFALTAADGRLHLEVTVPESQTPVLEAVVDLVEHTRPA